MFYNKINSALETKNKTNFVLLFSFIFLFFLSFNLFLNSKTSHLLQDNSKNESVINKAYALADINAGSAISLDDIDLGNPFFVSSKTFTPLSINSFDNRSILKDHQIRIQFHLPLFLRYHAIKIP